MRRDRQLLECEWLVVRSQRGDPDAFNALMRMWERSLFYYLRRLAPTEEDAWDWLQETWLKVFRAVATLRDPQTLPAFLYQTARRTALSRLRSPELQRPTEAWDDEDCVAAEASPSDFDNAEEVHRALDQLPLIHREILTLYFLQDLSLEETAAVLEVPLGTVKSRLFHAKKSIAQRLTERSIHES
jgi:RNA polymerase sigma factor (sigma-70 family)